MSENYTVYMHRFPNGKVYIGITKQTVEERWRNGDGYKAQLVHRAIEKYGWGNIEHIVLASCLSKKDAEDMEIRLINDFKSTCPEFGYNVENGGNCIGTHSEETKRKIAESNRRRVISEETRKKQSISHKGAIMPESAKEKLRAVMLGRVASDETRAKMSAASKGHVLSAESRAKISEAKKGKHISFSNGEERSRKISDAMKARNVNNPEIHKKMLDAAAKKCSKSVVQKDEDGSVVAIWSSAAEIEKNLGINHVYISRACHSESGKLCGYVWEFA